MNIKDWLKRFLFLKETNPSADTESNSREAVDLTTTPSEARSDFFVADAPLTDPALDRFKRWSFAQRIAQTIASRRDPSSIVVGIYGSWGEGKTTVLNFIKKELEKNEHIICLRFNPWRFTDETHLLRNFFQSLADALGKSISSKKEKIGKWIQDYATILAPISFTLGGVVQLSPAESAKEIGKGLSTVELEELRKRIEDVLKQEKKRLVVLMDDIDRLDKEEIQAVFKLLKLSADFAYTAYVVAFDEKMVAAALKEKYSSWDAQAGQIFLEKIVQVPLSLPIADRISLRKFCFEGVDEAIKEAKVELTQDHVQAFVSHFIDGLEIRLGTPRMAVRYGNALMFSLPILKGEVHPVDLMLVEGLRVFYPKLYNVVRSNPDVVLGSHLDDLGDKEQAKKHSLEVINKGLEGLTADETEAAKDLLKVLFPRLSGVFRNIHYGGGWEETWGREQRVASKQYFGRFFSYSIPEGDVSDQELDSFIGRCESEPVDQIVAELRKIINERNADVFVLKLRTREKKLNPNVSRNLALAIVKVGDSLPNSETLFSFTTAFSQAAILVSHLISNIPKGKDRFDAVRQIAKEGQPLSFATECFNWIRTKEKTKEEDKIFSEEEEDELGRIVADRIKNVSQKQPIYIECPKDTPFLLYVWTRWGSKEEVNQYLTRTIDDNPHNALELLKCYLPTSWGSESGPHKGDFRGDQYDAVTKVADADVLFNALRKIYGSDLESPQYDGNSTRSLDEQVAHQFAYIYHHVKREKAEATVSKQETSGKA